MNVTHIESEPGVGRADENLRVLPLAEVVPEVGPAGLGCADKLDSLIGVLVVGTSGQEVVDILGSLVNVALDIHGETGRLGDGETEVESDDGGDNAETDENTPHLVDLWVVA